MTESQPTTILAVVPEDGGDGVRNRAVELARDAGAGLILWDADAGSSLLADPLPNQFAADGEQEQFGERLTVNDLEAAGRGPLARQVRAVQEAGVEAWAWLPTDGRAETLRDYAARHGVGLVVLDEGSRLRHDLEVAGDIRVEVVGQA